MKRFLTALGFLTIIPSPRHMLVSGKALGKSMAVFPLVGLLLGGALVILNALLSPHISERLVNIIIIAVLFIVTGGLHMDGFIDTVDGLAGGKTKEDVLRIMRDSRVGALGVAAACLLIVIKWEALNSINMEIKAAALIIMPVVSRWGMALVAHISCYAREEGIGRPFVKGLTRKGLLFAFITVMAAAIVFGGGIIRGAIIVLAASLVCLLWSKWFEKKIGGVTGDVIGALNEVLEVMTLLFFAAVI